MNKNKNKRRKIDKTDLILYILFAITIIFLLSLLALYIYCFVVYGKCPQSSIPTWVAAILFRR